MKVRKSIFCIILMLLIFSSYAYCDDNKKYKGITITVGVQDASAIGAPAKAHAKTWEKRTGGKVNVLQFPYGKLFNEFNIALTTKSTKYDVLFCASAWAGDFYPYIEELPDYIADDESFDDIHPTYRDRLMKWNGNLIAVTVDGDLFNGYFRKDLFEDTKNREDFKKIFGYDLKAPDTWKEYSDIANFFTGRTSSDGKKLYGSSEAFARGGQQFWDVFSRASAYTNHPDNPGAQFFDPKTMKAQINNPGWIKAVEEYVDILQYCPPEAINFGIVEVRKAFVDGYTAMALDWGDTGQISADPKRSSIVGKVGYFVLPGTNKVWNLKKQSWDKFEKPHKAPFLAFGGWVGVVPKSSLHKEAAWDYIMWYSNPENSLKDVVKSGTGVNPYRFTHFTNIDAWTKAFSKTAASQYLNVLRASLDSPNSALDLRIPGFNDYTESFEIYLTRALKKEISVKKALDTIAVEWEKITDKYGRKKQLEIYRSSMGL